METKLSTRHYLPWNPSATVSLDLHGTKISQTQLFYYLCVIIIYLPFMYGNQFVLKYGKFQWQCWYEYTNTIRKTDLETLSCGQSRGLKCLVQLNCQLGFVCLSKNMINNSLSTLAVQLL